MCHSIPIGRDPSFVTIQSTLEREFTAMGHEYTAADANNDPSKQISDVETLLQQGCGVLIISPIDTQGIQPALDRVREQDIPIVVQETEEGGPYATNVQTSNYQAAAEAAAYLAEELGEGARVAALEGPAFAEVLIARNTGFREGAAEAGLEVIATGTNAEITPEGGRAVAATWQQQFGTDLQAIWAFNDTTALGAAAARSGDFQPLVVGMNGDQGAIEAIRAGSMAATWDLQTVKYSKALAWAADQALQGEELPETINIAMRRIDADNVDEWVPPEELLEEDFAVELEERDGQTFLVTE
jgi:ribose transport system substrate-binding protein